MSELIPDLEIDALLITSLPNVRYLSGFTGSNGQILLMKDHGTFLTDSRYAEQSRHEVVELEHVVCVDGLAKPLADLCREHGIARLGFESEATTVAEHNRLAEGLGETELVGVGPEVERRRWIKDPDELRALRTAQEITDRAFEGILDRLALGVTEASMAWALERILRENGAEDLAFEPIVAFGESAAEPHHSPGHRMLEEGDIVKLDFGARWAGYHADMTRTVAFGSPSSELRNVHEVVREAQQAAINAMEPGISCSEVDLIARSRIDEAGYGAHFGHGLGHGVGLEIHEGPRLSRTSDDELPVGAVVTVEPGVYLAGVGGIRIEDMVEVRDDGPRVLGTSPRELLEL
jgi:Xaa-Pro aminopeptidase